MINMKKALGIGGIFFKCKDPKAVKEWYAQKLGVVGSEWGVNFDWVSADDPTKKGSTAWSPFKADTKYFDPSEKDFMINYLVEDLETLVAELKAAGVTVLDEIESSYYGKFVHIMDPEGNKVELWEKVGD